MTAPLSTWDMIDLFSGIGGFSLAARWTGRIHTTAFCEIDPFCRSVLRKHWPHVPTYEDVRLLTPGALLERGVGQPDLLVGGFPCQGISIAGKGGGLEDARSGLWYEMLRIITDLQPRFLLIENVPRLRTLGADTVLEGLEAAGYACEALVVGADDIGAPHRRKRVWIAGCRPGDTPVPNAGSRTNQLESRELADRQSPQSLPDAADGSLAPIRGVGLADPFSGRQLQCSGSKSDERRWISDSRGEGQALATVRGIRRGASCGIAGQPPLGSEAVADPRCDRRRQQDQCAGIAYADRDDRGRPEASGVIGDSSAGFGMADTAAGFLPVAGPRPEGRDGPGSDGESMAHSHRAGRLERRLPEPGGEELAPSQCSREVAYSDSGYGNGRAGSLQMGRGGFAGDAAQYGTANDESPVEPGLGLQPSRISRWLAGCRWPTRPGCPQEDWEAPRTGTKIPMRAMKLKALGNSIVPQVAYCLLMAMLEVWGDE